MPVNGAFLKTYSKERIHLKALPFIILLTLPQEGRPVVF